MDQPLLHAENSRSYSPRLLQKSVLFIAEVLFLSILDTFEQRSLDIGVTQFPEPDFRIRLDDEIIELCTYLSIQGGRDMPASIFMVLVRPAPGVVVSGVEEGCYI